MLGTGKYRNAEEMNAALEASGCEIVTVALRRIDLDAPKRSILDEIDWERYHILPNTAGARTADEAVRTARLARAMGLSDWIKVEVIPDPKYLLPDPIGTFEACKTLVAEGFIVLPYINADPALALRLQEIGTHTVMPLASPIGSGQGLKTREQMQIIIEQATVPVVVDAGIGVPSEASAAMELGASACLINTAIARASDPAKPTSRAGCPSCPTLRQAARWKASCGDKPAAPLPDAGHRAVPPPATDRGRGGGTAR